MKQFRETNYWVNGDGKVFRYWPERYWEWESKNQVGKMYKFKTHKPEKWGELKSHQQKNKYLYVTIHTDGKPKTITVHRLVAEIYVPGYFEGAHIDHIDNNPLNNHYTNLQWCTQDYNSKKGSNSNYPLFVSSDG
tara:strand:- start:13 stop:417 length:405 start_codon:yes stop_codon:yes gene_type:complete